MVSSLLGNLDCQRRQWQPTPVLLPENSHGLRSLVGCSPWGRYESDTTERLHFHFSRSCIGEGNGNPLQHSCLVGCRLWGRTESDTTEATQQQLLYSDFCLFVCSSCYAIKRQNKCCDILKQVSLCSCVFGRQRWKILKYVSQAVLHNATMCFLCFACLVLLTLNLFSQVHHHCFFYFAATNLVCGFPR